MRPVRTQEEADYMEFLLAGVRQYGPAPGAKVMLENERTAANTAIETGQYAVWRSCTGNDCFRIAPHSKCFCGHPLSSHEFKNSRALWPHCTMCECKAYAFVPTRPEEVGEWWLPRRPGFDVRTWRAKCKCKHTHEEHMPNRPYRCRKCPCSTFTSAFLCIACDKHWEDHETVFESEAERRAAGRPVNEDFVPFAEMPEFYEAVYHGTPTHPQPGALRPPQPSVRPSLPLPMPVRPRAITHGGEGTQEGYQTRDEGRPSRGRGRGGGRGRGRARGVATGGSSGGGGRGV
ncbi:unnamed protein product [Vitrella brassicaformis CCMP3155]|uniref:Uncharacterized protein n=2 Tax=Vitrella brassicaformis TaxID=1169539 RepID=A0A0G4EG44_VITBC|nr:unnamed protein product [Vitrella brassicaformis CCMP3155]|eukprot:CEL95496.1 unnamed protein product [Vitrella brassicaformis CCMP3155]